MSERNQAERDRLAGLLRSAARAHRGMFPTTEGDDPDWPLWFAEHLRDSINDSLDRDFSVSDVVDVLVSARRTATDVDPAHWPEYYADFFMDLP